MVATVEGRPIRLLEQRAGALAIWQQPEEGHKYVLAVDTSGGGPQGDFAAGLVIKAEDCSLCALWKARCNPIPWGRNMAMLGWHYGHALMAVETHPSPTGYATAHEAIAFGYRNMYQRRQIDSVTREVTRQLGFHTNSTTKPILISRIQEALADGVELPSEELIVELGGQRKNAVGKMVADDHDDVVVTLGIALVVRDEAWQRNELRRVEPPARTVEERVWQNLMGPARGDKRRHAC